MELNHRHFLERIQANPDDDLPRLIYADWLEDQGDPRAELLRRFVALRSGRRGSLIVGPDLGAVRQLTPCPDE
jgi:uncharacterized protein (TIGR02996 family)